MIENSVDLIITTLGWFTLGFISMGLLLIIGKVLWLAVTTDYKIYKHVRLLKKILLRKSYHDYALLLLYLDKDTEVYRLTHPETITWTFDDWKTYYLNKANIERYNKQQKNNEKKY